jgi:DNA-binding XRE family transcriptional regulator
MTPPEFRAALARLGLSQGEAAEALGISTRTVNGYANGWPIAVRTVKLLELMLKDNGDGEA